MSEVFPGDLAEYVAEQQRAWRVPALVVGIRVGGRDEVRGFGAAPEARFRIASLTKPFTATLAALLAAEGQLDLEEAALGEPFTVAQALSHSTGLASELPGGLERFGSGDEALEAALAERALVPRYAAPGELWAYGNFGYWLAGGACARAHGGTYEQALQERVLEPLGLGSTGFDLELSVEGHDPYQEPPRAYPRARRPSGGLVSTAGDLLRFAGFHLGDGEVASELRRPRIAALGACWALGWQCAGRVIGHPGNWGGFRSRLALVPDRGIAVVALASSSAAGRAVERVVDRVLERHAGIVPAEPEPVAVPRASLERLAGRYRAVDRELRVTEDHGGLVVESDGEPPVLGHPVSNREFVVLEGDEAGWRFDFPRPGLARMTTFAERVP